MALTKDKKGNEILSTAAFIPSADDNWKDAVSIGGIVCMVLCAY